MIFSGIIRSFSSGSGLLLVASSTATEKNECLGKKCVTERSVAQFETPCDL